MQEEAADHVAEDSSVRDLTDSTAAAPASCGWVGAGEDGPTDGAEEGAQMGPDTQMWIGSTWSFVGVLGRTILNP